MAGSFGFTVVPDPRSPRTRASGMVRRMASEIHPSPHGADASGGANAAISRCGPWHVGRSLAQVAALLLLCLGTPAWADLALYATTERADVVGKAPHRWEMAPGPAGATSEPIYIERDNPRVWIKDADIESVLVEERRTEISETGQKVSGDPYYSVTFI